MGKSTGISWTNSTWNPWVGCKKISAGCKNCYMFREMAFHGQDPSNIHRTRPATFNAPLRWKLPALVFTCSWSDFFIEEADPWRDEAWSIIKQTPHLTYQILTKRVMDMRDCLPDDWGDGYPNVWLGVTIENQNTMWRAEALAEIPARLRFISYEPALGPADFSPYTPVINWLIIGGESGPGYRHNQIEWFRQALHSGIQWVFVKQLGGWPDQQADPTAWPAELRIQQIPDLRGE